MHIYTIYWIPLTYVCLIFYILSPLSETPSSATAGKYYSLGYIAQAKQQQIKGIKSPKSGGMTEASFQCRHKMSG